MARFMTILALAASAVALPNIPRQVNPAALGDTTLGSAQPMCGNNLQINCCNSEKSTSPGDSAPQGLIPGLLDGLIGEGGLGLFDECSPLTVGGILGVSDLLRNHCHAKVACCDRSQTVTGGLINIGLPCIALGSVA